MKLPEFILPFNVCFLIYLSMVGDLLQVVDYSNEMSHSMLDLKVGIVQQFSIKAKYINSNNVTFLTSAVTNQVCLRKYS